METSNKQRDGFQNDGGLSDSEHFMTTRPHDMPLMNFIRRTTTTNTRMEIFLAPIKENVSLYTLAEPRPLLGR